MTNAQKEPFNSPQVRLVINHAVDMDAIVEASFGNTGEVAATCMPPTVPCFNGSVERYRYDRDRARRMLRDAGAENLRTEPWYMPIPRPHMPNGKGIAQAMPQGLEEVGANARLLTYEWSTYLEKTGSDQHPMCLLGWTGDNGDQDNFLNVLLGSATSRTR